MTLALAGGSQDFPLTLTHVLGRARTVHRRSEVVSRRPVGAAAGGA